MFQALIDLGPIIVGLVGILLGYFFNIRMLRQQRHDDEREEIYKKLNAFYGPLQQHLGKVYELYKVFTVSRDSEFRTLKALLNGEKFKGIDKVLLEEILDIDAKMEKLIASQSGLIDTADMRQLLAEASAHFRILRVIYDKGIQEDTPRFDTYVFPRELDEKVECEISRLKTRLEELNKV